MTDQMLARPLTIQQLRQLQWDLHDLAKPFVRAKCDVLDVSLPTITIYPDGRIDTVYDARTYRMLAEWDNLWLEAREQYLARIRKTD